MFSSTGFNRLTKTQRYSAAGVAAAGAAALTLTLVPGASGAEDHAQQAKPATVHAETAAFAQDSFVPSQRASIDQQGDVAEKRAKDEAAAKKKAEEARKKAEAAKEKAAAEKKAQQERAAKEAASRKAKRAAIKSYPDNLDGWIREAMDIMKSKGIPGSYDGIKRNIMRESGGDPNAQNNTDVNAQNGTPSVGLLQVIQPTFETYHVQGTKDDPTDPVANIVAACNYAAKTYGSMDNVNSAY